MTGATRRLLILIGLVGGPEANRRFGILGERRGMADLAVVLLALGMGGMIERYVAVLRREDELRRGRLLLRDGQRQTEDRNQKNVNRKVSHIQTRLS